MKDGAGLPQGEYLTSVSSPNNLYQINAYRFSGGATMDWSLRCEVYNTATKERKDIYWVYHQKEADIKWMDNENVVINEIKINIFSDSIYSKM